SEDSYRLITLSRPPLPGKPEALKGAPMSHVFVVDANRKPLDPVHPGQARLLLTQKKAAVFRCYPFTIILQTRPEHPEVHPLRLKIDPGSQTTGSSLINEASGEVVFPAEPLHRARAIKPSLDHSRRFR